MVDKQGWMRYNNQRRRETNPRRHKGSAAVAHLVERHLAKVEVASSSLVGRSILWKFSSAGRASALQAEGQRFEPVNFHHCGPVAQLVRAPACHAGGRRFEPDPGRFLFASVAQSVEQGTENPRVIGSIPIGGTTSKVQSFAEQFCEAKPQWQTQDFLLSPQTFASQIFAGTPDNVDTLSVCGRSSSGRAPPCQGGGSEFEPRRPLQHEAVAIASCYAAATASFL